MFALFDVGNNDRLGTTASTSTFATQVHTADSSWLPCRQQAWMDDKARIVTTFNIQSASARIARFESEGGNDLDDELVRVGPADILV
jgi:hypothetical protein